MVNEHHRRHLQFRCHMQCIFVYAGLVILTLSCNTRALDPISRYIVEMDFNRSQSQMDCRLLVTWNNSSPKDVAEIPFQFHMDSSDTLIKQCVINDHPVKEEYRFQGEDGFEGFILKPRNPIPPYGQANIEIEYTTHKKEYYRDRILFFSEDIPIIPYFEDGQFLLHFRVHSHYSVTIAYDSEFEIATTGMTTEKIEAKDRTTIQTEAYDVPSYGVVLLKDVLIKEKKVENKVLVRSIYFEDDQKWGEKLLEYTEDIIPFYEDALGFYPQPVLTIIPGGERPIGGWPVCPNIVGIHRGIDSKGSEAESHARWITAHEIGHQYWGFNYILEPLNYPQWFGISMGIYTDRLYATERNIQMDYRKFLYKYLFGIYQGYNTTIMQKIKSLNDQGFDWNNVIQHGKAYTVIRLLAFEIGEDTFYRIFKYCLKYFKGKNVTLDMFQDVCEKISKRDLDRFFQQWFYSNGNLDYRAEPIIQEEQNGIYQTKITINRMGENSISEVELAIQLKNGDMIYQTINGREKQVVIERAFKYPVSELVVDPDFKLPLVNKIPELMKNIKR